VKKNVQTFQSHESELIYDDDLLIRSDEYLINLDRSTQEELDTSYIGYRELLYDGTTVIAEKVFEFNWESQNIELKFYKEFEYDLMGNLIQYICLDDINGDTVEAFSYIYDTHRNPFSSLNLIFDGETYVNNITERKDLLNDELYTNDFAYTLSFYPEQINIKLSSFLTEIVTIVYTCEGL
jgi:hypothetical protein